MGIADVTSVGLLGSAGCDRCAVLAVAAGRRQFGADKFVMYLFSPQHLLMFSSFVLLEFRIPSGKKGIGIKPRSTAKNKDSNLGPVAWADVGWVSATRQLPASFNQ